MCIVHPVSFHPRGIAQSTLYAFHFIFLSISSKMGLEGQQKSYTGPWLAGIRDNYKNLGLQLRQRKISAKAKRNYARSFLHCPNCVLNTGTERDKEAVNLFQYVITHTKKVLLLWKASSGYMFIFTNFRTDAATGGVKRVRYLFAENSLVLAVICRRAFSAPFGVDEGKN